MDKIDINEYNRNPVKKINRKYKRKNKKRKLKKQVKILIIILLLSIICGYFFSDLSKVKTIKVVGNSDVSSDTIITSSNIDTKTIYIFINKDKTEEKIKALPLIKKASVSYNVFGDVTIEIEESQQVAYCVIDEKTYVLDELGSVVETDDDSIKEKLKSCPKLSNFDSLEFLQTFAKEYAKVPSLIKNQTSDIIYSPLNADETRIRFVLDNSKELIVRVEDMADELSRFPFEAYMIEKADKCYFDFYGDHIYPSDCDD